jgi:hypothetical protein
VIQTISKNIRSKDLRFATKPFSWKKNSVITIYQGKKFRFNHLSRNSEHSNFYYGDIVAP